VIADGGQMVFVLLELFRGKKMDIRIQNGIQAIAVLILASLSFYLITGDVTRGVISPIQKALESGQIQIQSPLK
jgi:membrane-associated protease RseP (regulator of RpoE activity)